MSARVHVELFLDNSHCWAHSPEEVCGCNDLGPVVWGTESSVNLLKKTIRTYMFKINLNLAQKLITVYILNL